ncbi:MAG TPA: DUF6113 family protein [Jiangellaceae bacterium]|nr:DUF6113 family protein [Jiangellaceae bacterium]
MSQVARTAGLCIVAAVSAVAAAFVHLSRVRIGVVHVPYGLGLALAGLAAVMVLAHARARSRLDKILVAAAGLVPVFVLSQERGAGDVVIAAGMRGLVFLYGGVMLVGIFVALPTMRQRQDTGVDRGVR